MEGHFHTGPGGTPLYLFGWPDQERQVVRGGIAVPGMLSMLVYQDPQRPVPGLDQLQAYGSPPVWLTFQAYHLMVGMGLLFIAGTLTACWFWWRGSLFRQRWLLWFFVFAVIPAFAANELGWVATEVGRQPWVVYPTVAADGTLVGGLQTSHAVSEVLTGQEVLVSICMFGALYALLFALWLYLLNRAIQHGPPLPQTPEPQPLGSAATVLAQRRGSLSGTRPEGN
jgi:cytochrome d ubiquinol oxidase subunit I